MRSYPRDRADGRYNALTWRQGNYIRSSGTSLILWIRLFRPFIRLEVKHTRPLKIATFVITSERGANYYDEALKGSSVLSFSFYALIFFNDK